MVLEATVICMDNSEFVRNSDYAPTRLQVFFCICEFTFIYYPFQKAEADAVNLLAGAKTQNNPENSVGILSLAGKVPRVLVTPTHDLGRILNSVHGISIEGEINLVTGIQVAHLALKHRQNKHQRMRVVVFVGSPITNRESELIGAGRKLKKCNVALDIVSFGVCAENKSKLESLLAAVNKNGNSHLINVQQGESISDALIATHIFNSGGSNTGSGFAAAAATANISTISGTEEDLGDDPALMLALRASLEEERLRQEGQESQALEISDHIPQEEFKGDMRDLGLDKENAKEALQDSEYVTSVLNSLPGVTERVSDSQKNEEAKEKKTNKDEDED